VGKVHEEITPRLREWIEAQHLFFVATAPLDAGGHINVSPRGLPGTFAVLEERRVAWLDLTGSGAETIAHLRENGRIVVMFCAFEGPPQIVRLHGRGRVVVPSQEEWQALSAHFPAKRSARAVIVVDVERISDSCGFGVPRLEFVDDRDLLDRWADNRDDDDIAAYRADRNATSLDGLPALRTGDDRP
jgi:Pyridoxamine 5'-phosphate oxidase